MWLNIPPSNHVHLKRLQLTGFKTFADRTEILFSPGVTAIVGPNGSGKSNIADSVLWALGEQKASAVRGVRNQDVIFNGSAKRKQTGLAEVSLTVDNSDGVLPLSFNEVTVTRRALRSGDSEYYINKTACRLKDIYELFLDTGVGREAYALVNQSEIDAVLTAAPEARRGLFEEAAGIKKYRVKKREALRKLETTELNLSRITDIIGEIGRQLAPLHLQAETAKKYIELKKQLTTVEENYLIRELRTADEQLRQAQDSRTTDETLVAEITAKLCEAEAHCAELAERAADAEALLEQLRVEHQSLAAASERLHHNRKLSLERLQELSIQEDIHRSELRELQPTLEDVKARIALLENDVTQTGAQSGDRERVQVEGEDELRRLNDTISSLQLEVGRRRKEAETAARRQASEEGELARAEARLSEARSSRQMLEQERERLLGEQEATLHSVTAAEEALTKADAEVADAAGELSEAKNKRQEVIEKTTDLRHKHEALRGESLSISIRLKSLQDLENAQEGYFAGVKAVLSASKSGRLTGRYLVVADSFEGPEHLVTALETAFGSSLQDIITDTEDEATSAIEYLKRGSHGRATFLPLPRMNSSRSDIRLPAGRLSGYLGRALDLISFAAEVLPALEALIGRVLICEAVDDALKLSNSSSGWSKIVTVGGEVIVPSGAITGGSNNRRGNSLLERKSEVLRLDHSLTAQRKAEAKALAESEAAVERLNEQERVTNQIGERLAQRRLQQSAARQALDRSRRDSQQATERLAAHDRRIATANDTVRLTEDRLQTCEKLLKSLETSVQVGDGDEDQQKLRELMTERELLSGAITQEKIVCATLNEKSSGFTRALRQAVAEAEQLTSQQRRRLSQLAQAVADHTTLSETLLGGEELINSADHAVAVGREKLEAQKMVRHGIAAEAAASTALIRELNNNRAAALASSRKNELAETRLELIRQQVAARLLEEYDVTAEYALSLEETPATAAEAPKEVVRIRRDIKSLGEVNVSAVEEFEQLSERFAYMTGQKEDAHLAKDRVYAAIKEIDESTREVFMKTFHEVQIAFQTVFQRLFVGGAAHVKLTNPEDLLETGVDILVQLPGKKQQNLQLLSGGERALTALALLFAFLKVRPSPFCLLDEVDAPLDGANIERFADVLRDFGQTTQFLVITHNPATMEAANVWYGVTMQEPGISRILSLQVPQLATETV